MTEPKSLQDMIDEVENSAAMLNELDKMRGRAPANARQEGGKHYKTMGIQPWDVVDTWPIEQQIGYHRGGALKYLMRMGTKDERVQEAKKAAHYVQKLIEILEKPGKD